MLGTLNTDFEYQPDFLSYKNIFRQAGAIREESLHIEKLKDNPGSGSKSTSSAFIKKLNNELVKSAPTYLKGIGAVKDGILKEFDKLDQKKILPYCKKLFKQLARNWKKVNSKSDLHEFRKQLKQVLYCSQLLGEQEKSEIASEKRYKKIDELQDIIGQWHDNVLLLNKIEKENLKRSGGFVSGLKHQTHHLLIKAHKKGSKL